MRPPLRGLPWLIAAAALLAVAWSLLTASAAGIGSGPIDWGTLYACESPAPAEVSTGTTSCP